MEKVYKVCVVSLLAGILATLILISIRLPASPPTLLQLRNADAETRQRLLQSKPLVQVSGSVDVDNTVDVQGSVDVGNTIDVQGSVDVDNLVQVDVVR